MSTLVWGSLGERRYEAGVDRGVFYPKVGPGVAWNGLLSVDEAAADEDQTFIYYDAQKVRSQVTLGHFAASISALTYPTEFEDYRDSFGLSYRTGMGNDLVDIGERYKLHLVYNALATPTQKHFSTLTDNSNLTAFSWDLSTTPVAIQFARASAHLVIDSAMVNPGVLEEVEELLYGSDTGAPTWPSVQDVLDIFDAHALFQIIDHGDGSFTATGPDDAVFLTSPTEFQLSWPSVVMISEDTYRASTF